jgi:hypothetical protein
MKKGNTIEHKGCKYKWCSKHSSKGGSINCLYMPYPHNHDKWAKNKASKTATFKKRKEEDKKSSGSGNSANKKLKKGDEALKLALGTKLTTTLVKQHHMSQADAESAFTPSTRTSSLVSSKTSETGDRQ